MDIVNIAAYKFISLPESYIQWQPTMQERCDALELKGTIILASEGINLVLAGERANIDAFVDFLKHHELFEGAFSDLTPKESISDSKPFGKMVVRLAKEIITMRVPDMDPVKKGRGASVDSQTLRRWLGQGHDDDGREVVMLDTRNTYETDIGTFKNAITLEIERFSEFPEAIAKTVAEQEELKEKTVVSFCTGGIRCEKAVLYMNDIEMQRVYQLEGGILKYFEETGGEHWQGECFVFDDRVAVDASLNKTTKDYPRHIGPRDTMS